MEQCHASFAFVHRRHLPSATAAPRRSTRRDVRGYLVSDIMDNLVGKSTRKIVDKANKNAAVRKEPGPFSSEFRALFSFASQRSSSNTIKHCWGQTKADIHGGKKEERFEGRQTSFRILKTFLLLRFFPPRLSPLSFITSIIRRLMYHLFRCLTAD